MNMNMNMMAMAWSGGDGGRGAHGQAIAGTERNRGSDEITGTWPRTMSETVTSLPPEHDLRVVNCTCGRNGAIERICVSDSWLRIASIMPLPPASLPLPGLACSVGRLQPASQPASSMVIGHGVSARRLQRQPSVRAAYELLPPGAFRLKFKSFFLAMSSGSGSVNQSFGGPNQQISVGSLSCAD